ncbi:hypothetical protein ACFQDG_02985 [Natronoarchaeum mannanilyticum]|uniref:Uncharacterized protein n=1 Tax=Natronoarchaeum mannanilyticum TaxID=926360 RepID=A0AAV3T5M3_9EURY
MAIHGQFVTDDWKYIRAARDNEDHLIRVFVHEEWYPYFKSLYDYAELLTAGVSIEEVPSRIESCFDWFSALTAEIGANGWIFSIAIIGWITHLVKNRIGIGEFTYDTVGYGDLAYGEAPYGGGTRILELPVEE